MARFNNPASGVGHSQPSRAREVGSMTMRCGDSTMDVPAPGSSAKEGADLRGGWAATAPAVRRPSSRRCVRQCRSVLVAAGVGERRTSGPLPHVPLDSSCPRASAWGARSSAPRQLGPATPANLVGAGCRGREHHAKSNNSRPSGRDQEIEHVPLQGQMPRPERRQCLLSPHITSISTL
jgi:hypothetical protein